MDDFHFPSMTTGDGTFIYSERELQLWLEKQGIDLQEIKKYYQEEAEQEIDYIKTHTDNLLDKLADSLEEGRHTKAYYAEQVRDIMRNEFSI